MKSNFAKDEMQSLIQQTLDFQNYQVTYESLKIYQKTFGTDEFFDKYSNIICSYGPLVSLICLNCPNEMIDNFLLNQNYTNLEVVRTNSEDTCSDIIDYISTTKSKYICFIEPNHTYSNNKIANMVWHLENLPDTQVAICPRNYINNNNIIIAHPDSAYSDALNNTIFCGKTFIEYNLSENRNLYGTLSTLLISTSYAQQIPWLIPSYSFNVINSLSLLYQFLLYGNIAYMKSPLVSTILTEYVDENDIALEYKKLVNELVDSGLIKPIHFKQSFKSVSNEILKDITFFYTDKGEYYNLKPIADAAVKRGYNVTFTKNITQKAEIGVYCQHVCYPENSKFSLILLHDLAQGHNRWPNLWELERWDKFDLGIVPGKFWSDLWEQCGCQYYANPRYGVYEFGYPKSDLLDAPELKNRAQELKEKFHLKYNYSVLYAPSWENNEKEDDFVRALASLNVNLLIKQAHWPDAYDQIINNICQMRKLHENKYDNLYYIEPEESIMTALELCDMVVSDESSVMSEAVMFGKPSVAVTDWLIPDTVPSRFASVPMNYVLKCKKVELREYVTNLAAHSTNYNSILEKGKLVFSNQGNCCNDILDAIDYFTQGSGKNSFQQKMLHSKYTICSMWN